MNPIEGKLYSPFKKETKRLVFKKGWELEEQIDSKWERRDATVNKIRISDGYPITTYRQLINEVALVTLNNKKYEMFYRGQSKDYKDNQSVYYKHNTPRSIIYPSICRPDRKIDGTYKKSVRKAKIQDRYDDLYNMIDLMTKGRNYHIEYYLALFQHYDILPTPFIDITQSLNVAASFALNKEEIGYVYVFGLPYPNQSISYYYDSEIILMKLQNVCPVNALRPRYQEGYLVGKYPMRPTKEGGDNLARRLIAKFKVDNSEGEFWDRNFKPIPNDILFPKDDPIESILKARKLEFEGKYRL